MQLNKVFEGANASRARWVLFKGSAGSGKSFNVAANLIHRMYTLPGSNALVIREIDTTNRISTFPQLQGAINAMGLSHEWESRLSPLQLTCKTTGGTVLFRGVKDDDQRERLKSVTVAHGYLNFCWIEEASAISYKDFLLIDDRIRGKLPPHLFAQIVLTFNPVSPRSWLKTKLWDKADQEPDKIFCCHSTYLDNHAIDQATKDKASFVKRNDPEHYRIYYEGEWGSARKLHHITKEELGVW